MPMTTDNSLQDLIDELELQKKSAVSFNTSFNHDTALALIKYTKDNGNKFPQDIIRNAVQIFLKKQGYLNI
jgi:hypothetical protein